MKELYWDIWRWCKWRLPYQHIYFMEGITNLYKWFWTIWRNREFDYSYYWEINKKKISLMRDHHAKIMKFENTPRYIEKMNTVLKLIDKIQNEYYLDECNEEIYYKSEMKVEQNGNIDFDIIMDKQADYVKKYPSAYRKIQNDPIYLKGEASDYKTALLMSIERHNKAKRILFRLLEGNIENWWN
jgi:hypothetical protein